MSKVEETLNNLSKESREIYSALVNQATVNAIKFIRNEEKNKPDRRLHNTYLLLEHYNSFKDSVSDVKCYGIDYNIDDLKKLRDDAFDSNESSFIESILKTKERTKAMINHIDICLELYKYKCQMSGKEEVERRYKVLNLLYIELKEDGTKYTTEEVAEKLFIATGTVSNTKKIAIQEFAIMVFGIDALKIY